MLPDNREDFYELIHHRIPPSVDPESALGRHYAQLIADLESTPPIGTVLSRTQINKIAVLLRGGGRDVAA